MYKLLSKGLLQTLTYASVIIVVCLVFKNVSYNVRNFVLNTIFNSDCDYHLNNTNHDTLEVSGIDFHNTKANLLDQSAPWNFLKDYKNPCWIERLPEDHESQYRKATFFRYGQKEISKIIPIFDERLKSNRPWRIRCLPYFFIVGVTKSGTTDVYDALKMHPDVYVPWVKEPMYWNRHRSETNVPIHAGMLTGHWAFSNYLQEYDYVAHAINQSVVDTAECGKQHQGITMDGSSYLFWEDNGWDNHPKNVGLKEPIHITADDIHAVLPEAKIIVMMRNPTERARSAFAMYVSELSLKFKRGKTTTHFHEYIVQGIRLYEDCFQEHGIRACAYNASLSCMLHPISLRPAFYSVYLRDWLRVFGKDQILVIKSEDYYDNRLKYIKDIWNFLGLRTLPHNYTTEITQKRASMKRKYDPMLPDTKILLDNFYSNFNKDLEKLLERKMWDD